MSAIEVTIPNVKLDLDDLLSLIRRLDAGARRRIAQVLADSEMDARLEGLIRQLAAKPSADDLSDADIDLEVKAVRQARTLSSPAMRPARR
jgi:hypothetical protein